MNLNAAAQTLRAAKQDYLAAFRQYSSREVRILPDERFWQLQTVFRAEVLTFCFAYRRTNGVEQAARELFRKPLAEDFADGTRYPLLEAVQFAKTWRQLSRSLAQPLSDVVCVSPGLSDTGRAELRRLNRGVLGFELIGV